MTIFIILAAIAAFLFWVSRKPDDFSIQRQISIDAPARDVFGWINNVRNFNQWNPWAAAEPTSLMTYNGTDEGPGASYSWKGKRTGEGSMTLLDQQKPNEVNFALEFLKPFKASNKASFRLTEGNGTTIVVWSMTGKNAFIHKLMQTFFSMDKMVGKDFERGLNSLKQLVESKKLS
jgi:Polyketide cyclase / dehydrase and lipid transport